MLERFTLDKKEIADMLESTVQELEHRDSVVSPQSMIIEFHDLVNRRLAVNLSVLEIMLYSSMVVSAANRDYSLPKPWTGQGVGVMAKLLVGRSLSATMAYEGHRAVITNPLSYTETNRFDHVMDKVLIPTA